MSYNIVIIGLGNIGLRHLESLLKSKYDLKLFLIDKSIISLKNAKKVITEKNYNLKINFSLHEKIIQFNEQIECAIISTTADVRYTVTKELLKKNKIKNIIFEKIVFNSSDEYKKILNVTKKNKIKCYINYPRKFMSSYQALKNELVGEREININLFGNNWGLASNSFHFLDIFSFLTNEKQIILSESNLYKKLYKTKRKGFYEIKGKLKFKTPNNHKLICEDDKKYKSTKIKIETENFILIIDETKKIISKIFYKKINKLKTKKFNFLFQSEITNQYIDAIIQKKKLSLTSLENSFDHFKLIINILDKIKKNKNHNLILT